MNDEQIIHYEETDEAVGDAVKKPPMAMSIISLVLGALSIILNFLGPIGITLGAVACKLARPIALKYPKTAVGRIAFVGKSTGAIGTVLSVISLIITLLIVVIVAVIIVLYVVPTPVVA